MNKILIMTVVLVLSGGAWAASSKTTIEPETVEDAIASSWTEAPADWRSRLKQDVTQRQCSQYRNAPPASVAKALIRREAAAIQYPADGRYLGDWKRGEALAQSGYGARFTDKDTTRPNGGNCYACHQISPKEISFGTLGPSLAGYGAARKFAEADVKRVYEKIYDSQSVVACSNMPRFGAGKFLTIEQIKDLVALLMDPESPVNK